MQKHIVRSRLITISLTITLCFIAFQLLSGCMPPSPTPITMTQSEPLYVDGINMGNIEFSSTCDAMGSCTVVNIEFPDDIDENLEEEIEDAYLNETFSTDESGNSNLNLNKNFALSNSLGTPIKASVGAPAGPGLPKLRPGATSVLTAQ